MVKAVVMAGGEGTRLRPLTVNRPKPMVPLVNKPMIEHVIDLLVKYGIRDIGITLYYLPETIMTYFGDGSERGVRIYYSIEDKPLGTAGGVKHLVDHYEWDDTLLIISGDVFTNIDLDKLLRYHREKDSVFTMAIRRVDDPTKYGIALLDDNNRVLRFHEKPSWSEVFSDLANMGIYVLEPEVLDIIESGREYDFAKHLIPKLLKTGKPVYGWRADQYYWSDIGSIDQYKETHWDILSGRVDPPKVLISNRYDRRIISEDAVISPKAVIIPPVIIGSETRVEDEAVIGPYTVIGDNVIIERKARLEKTIIWNQAYIGYNTRILDAIIGEKTHINEHVVIHEGAVIGDEVVIGRGSQVKQGVKIWPSKIIDPYTVVSLNIKWGIRWYKTLIEPWGITGLVNIEITPELATRIGAAIGSVIAKNKIIAIARDNYATSRVIKHSLLAGIMSTGIRIIDLRTSPLPVLTNYIKRKKLGGGVVVTSLVYDPFRVRIKIFSDDGKFINSKYAKKIENVFFKEAYRKVLGDQLGDLYLSSDHVEEYIYAIENHIDTSMIQRNPVLVDCSYGSVGAVWPRLSQYMGLTTYQVNCSEYTPIIPPREPVIHSSIDTASKIIPLMNLRVGFIFDSDGDKVIMITETGRAVSSDKLVALIARILLERSKGGKIIIPHNASQVVVKTIEKYGGEIIYAGQGLMGISEKINEDVLMAADERGGIIYPWIHYGADAIYTALLVTEYLAENKVKLSDLLDELPQTTIIKERIIVPYDLRGRFMRMIYEELREKEIDTLDGIKIIEDELGFGYIRPLPSEPIIEITAESESKERAEKLAKILMDIAYRVKSKL